MISTFSEYVASICFGKIGTPLLEGYMESYEYQIIAFDENEEYGFVPFLIALRNALGVPIEINKQMLYYVSNYNPCKRFWATSSWE